MSHTKIILFVTYCYNPIIYNFLQHLIVQLVFYRVNSLHSLNLFHHKILLTLDLLHVLHKFQFLILAYFGILTVATLLCVLPVLYVIIPLMFAMLVYVYNTELSVSEILKIAFWLGHKKWGLTFIITLVNTLLIFLMNMLTFGLGGLFLGCFVEIPIYIIYKKTIGISQYKLI